MCVRVECINILKKGVLNTAATSLLCSIAKEKKLLNLRISHSNTYACQWSVYRECCTQQSTAHYAKWRQICNIHSLKMLELARSFSSSFLSLKSQSFLLTHSVRVRISQMQWRRAENRRKSTNSLFVDVNVYTFYEVIALISMIYTKIIQTHTNI